MTAAAPGPLLRRGPRPLLLHLMLAMLRTGATLRSSASVVCGSDRSRSAVSRVAMASPRPVPVSFATHDAAERWPSFFQASDCATRAPSST